MTLTAREFQERLEAAEARLDRLEKYKLCIVAENGDLQAIEFKQLLEAQDQQLLQTQPEPDNGQET